MPKQKINEHFAKVINNYNVNNIFVDLKINKDNFIIKNINQLNKNILKHSKNALLY